LTVNPIQEQIQALRDAADNLERVLQQTAPAGVLGDATLADVLPILVANGTKFATLTLEIDYDKRFGNDWTVKAEWALGEGYAYTAGRCKGKTLREVLAAFQERTAPLPSPEEVVAGAAAELGEGEHVEAK
jgi:hypothetical protein